MSDLKRRSIFIVWLFVLVLVGYQGNSLYQDLWGNGLPLDSAVQQAAISAYRTGMMVTFYAVGRALTQMLAHLGQSKRK